MKRFTDWHHLTLRGDKAVAARYVAEGRKYLGYVNEQLAVAGTFQQTFRRRTPEGVEFVARIAGEVASLTIDARRYDAARAEALTLDGFVVQTDPLTERAQVLLQPATTRADAWRRFFYDGSVVHPPIAGARMGVYGAPGGVKVYQHDPLDDVPNGLQLAGNLDWRNADESLSVSIEGPATRYFGDRNSGTVFGTKVYCKGQMLLDLAEVEGVVFGVAGGRLTGAAIRGGGGLKLVFTAAYGSPDPYEVEYVGAVPLRPRAAVPGQPPARAVYFEPIASDTVGLVALAGPHTIGTLHGYVHPWIFNQSGTQARRIRWEQADPAYAHEDVLDLADLAAVGFTTLSHAWPVRTSLTGYTARSGRKQYDLYTGPRMNASGGIYDTDRWVLVDGGPADGISSTTDGAVPAHAYLNAGYTWVNTSSWDSSPWVRAAVDFVDDAPVYADLRLPDVAETQTFARTRTLSSNHVLSNAVSTDPPLPFQPRNFTYDISGDYTLDINATFDVTRVTVESGLRTPWATIECGENQVIEASHDRGFTGSYAATGATAQLYDGDPDTWDLRWHMKQAADVASLSCNETMAVDYTRTDTLTSQVLKVGFLDLRYGWLVYGIETTTSTTTGTGARTDSASAADVAPAATGDECILNLQMSPGMPGLGGSVTVAGETVRTAKLYTTLTGLVGTLNSPAVLAESVELEVETSSSSVTTPDAISRTGNSAQIDAGAEPENWGVGADVAPETPPTVGAPSTDDLPADTSTLAETGLGGPPDELGDYLYGGSGMNCPWVQTTPGGERLWGAWQTYRGKYCFSQAWPLAAGGAENWLAAGGRYAGATATPSAFAPSALADVPTNTRLHPVWVLPKTTAGLTPA